MDPHHSQGVRAPTETEDVQIDPEDAKRPPGPMTNLAFKLALDGLSRELRDLGRIQRELGEALRGVKGRSDVDERTRDVLGRIEDELTGLNKVAYRGEATHTKVCEELVTMNATAQRTHDVLSEIRDSLAVLVDVATVRSNGHGTH